MNIIIASTFDITKVEPSDLLTYERNYEGGNIQIAYVHTYSFIVGMQCLYINA